MAIVSFKAGESISAGDAVFVSASGFAYKAIATSFENASVAGVAIDGGSAGSLVRVNADSLYESSSTFVPGETQYLSLLTSGDYSTYSVIYSGLALTSYEGVYLSTIGKAVTTSKLEVETSLPIFIQNPTSVLLLETHIGPFLDAILLEDGSTISLETAL
jgi:hypothetical protein